MGQTLNTMNHNQPHLHHKSKNELLYDLVCSDDVQGIKALCRDGVNLEWIDIEGKTPLIVACRNSGLIHVAKTLIEMGANIDAYRPGRKAGTPLHHAAKRGLEQTVKLLLSSGANALLRNDDGQTALDIARAKGHTSVVRAIEKHICYFSGWLREFYAPGFLEVLAPQFLSRQIWVVVIPCGFVNSTRPPKFELAIYSNLQGAQPRQIVALWKANIKEPDFQHSDPALSIFDQFSKTRFKLASANEGDKTQLYQLCNACKGIRQVMPFSPSCDTQTSIATSAPQVNSEATESNTNGWGDSSEVETCNGWSVAAGTKHTEPNSSGMLDGPAKKDYNGWIGERKEDYNGWGEPHSSGNLSKQDQTLAKNDSGWGEPHSRSSELDKTQAKDYNAVEVMPFSPSYNTQTSIATSAPQVNSEATESNTNGWGDSSEVETCNGWSVAAGTKHTEPNSSGMLDGPTKKDYNGWIGERKEDFNGWGEPHSSGNLSKQDQTLAKNDSGWGEHHSRSSELDKTQAKDYNVWAKQESDTLAKDSNGWDVPGPGPSSNVAKISLTPSAPPIPEEVLNEGPISYPSIDSNLVDFSVPTLKHGDSIKLDEGDSSCVLCWEAPVQGVLVPCGHMAGCMSCLIEINAKKGVCPLCRVKIDQVIRVYTV